MFMGCAAFCRELISPRALGAGILNPTSKRRASPAHRLQFN